MHYCEFIIIIIITRPLTPKACLQPTTKISKPRAHSPRLLTANAKKGKEKNGTLLAAQHQLSADPLPPHVQGSYEFNAYICSTHC